MDNKSHPTPCILLSLDPSSTVTGWAALSFGGRLLEGGLLKPNKKGIEPAARIDQMCKDLLVLLNEVSPSEVVLEWPSGHTGRRHHGHGSGLSTYGIAVGAIWRTCVGWATDRHVSVHLVSENLWTAGQSKTRRAAGVRLFYEQYNPDKDPGLDLADAIGLALYFLGFRRHGLWVGTPDLVRQGQITMEAMNDDKGCL